MYTRANLNQALQNAYYKQADIKGKRVLLRSCLNVILHEDGSIADDTRLRESLNTIQEVAKSAKQLIIVGHLGRPEGADEALSFKLILPWLQSHLDHNLIIVKTVEELTINYAGNPILLVENIRFFEGEESSDLEVRKTFAKSLARHADIFINDAFPDYRRSASTYDIATFLPAYLGETYYHEVTKLLMFAKPKRPCIAILGGAKLSEKLDTLNALLSLADYVLVGGAMAYTLLKAQGGFVGDSRVEDDKLGLAMDIVYKGGTKLILPEDHLIVEKFTPPAIGQYAYTVDSLIPPGKIGIDIGPKTIKMFQEYIAQAGSVLSNGPMGVFEWDISSKGTESILRSVAENSVAFTLIGGGDSIAAMDRFNISGFNHVCTGGGAMLAFLSYNEFPTLDVILDHYKH